LIQHYVIKFLSDFWQVCDFSTNKIDRHNITEILLKVALNTITPNPQFMTKLQKDFSTTHSLAYSTIIVDISS